MRNVLMKAVVAGTAATMLLLSACSSSGSSSGSGSGNTPTGASTPKIKGAPIVLGSICSCSGSQAASLALAKDSASAWADSVNAAGGINGHPVSLIVKDDAGDPATALQDVKELVEQDKVMAIVGETSLADSTWASYVAGKGIPVVGGNPSEAPFSSNPDFYASGSSVPVVTVGDMEVMKKQGKTNFGVMYCAESPVCAQLDGLSKLAASVVGGVKVTSTKVAATSPTYNSQCLAFKSAGVDGLWVATNSATGLRVISACKKLGYSPLNVTQASVTGQDWLSDPNVDGSFITAFNANYQDSSIPGVKDFLDAMDKYYPGDRSKAQFAYPVVLPWIGGKLFEAAAKAAKIGPTSTPADVKKGLYALKNETLDGLAPPLNFMPGRPAFPTCYFTIGVSGGKFTSPDGTKPTCLTTAQVTALTKGLGG